MKVKRYTGNSLEKIREVIVKELGEDAVIVNVKKQNSGPSGLLGFNQKPAFEVIAAIEDAENADGVSIDKLLKSPAMEEFIQAQKEQYRGLRTSIKMLDDKLAEVDEKMAQMKLQPSSEAGPKELANVHAEWRALVQQAVLKVAKSAAPSPEDWHEALASILPTAGGIMFRRTPAQAPDVYVIAGPTGVGKTTTLAKLAAKAVLGEGLKVGIITMDTFRVGAVDQLREYSALLGVELSVAFSSQELDQQIQNFAEKDLVLVDTPGRGQFDTAGIAKIREGLGDIPGLCVILVVTAGLRPEDAEAVSEAYGELKPSALILTKTDEAARCDGLTKLFDVSKLPVVYFADGQRVPEDLHVASPGVLASLIMPFVKPAEPVKLGGAAHVS
ncbi:MAG: hypothetical protein A2X49_07220 [Lentisphaerae bacterium GWF2_52_8]|nr:MAG: hypothetical protein A2X49_07220 [Lentisphaerae bacterium GWF2_52_8]